MLESWNQMAYELCVEADCEKQLHHRPSEQELLYLTDQTKDPHSLALRLMNLNSGRLIRSFDPQPIQESLNTLERRITKDLNHR